MGYPCAPPARETEADPSDCQIASVLLFLALLIVLLGGGLS
jgi:hypothetical protein